MHAGYGVQFIVLATVLTVADLCSLTVPRLCVLLLK